MIRPTSSAFLDVRDSTLIKFLEFTWVTSFIGEHGGYLAFSPAKNFIFLFLSCCGFSELRQLSYDSSLSKPEPTLVSLRALQWVGLSSSSNFLFAPILTTFWALDRLIMACFISLVINFDGPKQSSPIKWGGSVRFRSVKRMRVWSCTTDVCLEVLFVVGIFSGDAV